MQSVPITTKIISLIQFNSIKYVGNLQQVYDFLWIPWLVYWHKLSQICSVCPNHNPVLSTFLICNNSNRTDATRGAGTAYPS